MSSPRPRRPRSDPYAGDVLQARAARLSTPLPEVAATSGLVVRHRASGFGGAVAEVAADEVVLADGPGRSRTFPLTPGAFVVDGRTVTLVRPRVKTPTTPRTSASGSVAAPSGPARIARASRIWVEGTHDAELVEKVWGDDLREAGVVVEPLGGIDDLVAAVHAFGPSRRQRLGVLVDHLVPGSKETRIAAQVTDPHVLVTGHPYVDVWQGVRPGAVGIRAWPEVPRGQDWKAGVAAAFGSDDPPALWRRILRSVGSYADLEPPLVGAVERLLDFLLEVPTADPA